MGMGKNHWDGREWDWKRHSRTPLPQRSTGLRSQWVPGSFLTAYQHILMSMWSLRWHFTNRSVTGAPYSIKVTVCHTAGHYGEEYDNWNSGISRCGTAVAMAQNEQMAEERPILGHSTDLHIYNLGVVSPIHVVWNHVVTDKLTTANGGTLTSSSPVAVRQVWFIPLADEHGVCR